MLFPSGLSPHPTNAPLSRFPASEGGMKTGKKGIFENALLHLGVVLLLSKQAFIFVVLSSYNRGFIHSTATTSGPCIQYINMTSNGGLHQVQAGSGRLAGKVAIVTGTQTIPSLLYLTLLSPQLNFAPHLNRRRIWLWPRNNQPLRL